MAEEAPSSGALRDLQPPGATVRAVPTMPEEGEGAKWAAMIRVGDIIEVIDDSGWRDGPWQGTIAICDETTNEHARFRFITPAPDAWDYKDYFDLSRKCCSFGAVRVVAHANLS